MYWYPTIPIESFNTELNISIEKIQDTYEYFDYTLKDSTNTYYYSRFVFLNIIVVY